MIIQGAQKSHFTHSQQLTEQPTSATTDSKPRRAFFLTACNTLCGQQRPHEPETGQTESSVPGTRTQQASVRTHWQRHSQPQTHRDKGSLLTFLTSKSPSGLSHVEEVSMSNDVPLSLFLGRSPCLLTEVLKSSCPHVLPPSLLAGTVANVSGSTLNKLQLLINSPAVSFKCG